MDVSSVGLSADELKPILESKLGTTAYNVEMSNSKVRSFDIDIDDELSIVVTPDTPSAKFKIMLKSDVEKSKY